MPTLFSACLFAILIFCVLIGPHLLGQSNARETPRVQRDRQHARDLWRGRVDRTGRPLPSRWTPRR